MNKENKKNNHNLNINLNSNVKLKTNINDENNKSDKKNNSISSIINKNNKEINKSKNSMAGTLSSSASSASPGSSASESASPASGVSPGSSASGVSPGSSASGVSPGSSVSPASSASGVSPASSASGVSPGSGSVSGSVSGTSESVSAAPPSENKDEVFDTLKSFYNFLKNKALMIHQMLDKTPILIKILNIVIPFSISYIFTNIQYNIYVSIIFAVITLLAILFITGSIFFTALYLIFYIWLVSSSALNLNKKIGNPLQETDIQKNGEPFNCLGNYKIINANRFLAPDSSGSFSYSYWININTIKKNEKSNNNWFDYRNTDWKLIFYRGTEMSSDITNIDTQYPGFWLTPKLNNLVIVFQNNGSKIERIEMINIPLNTWVNITTVVERKSVSIYINGQLDRTLNLEQTNPDTTKNNVYIGEKNIKDKNVGFPGYLAQLTYFNYPLTPEIVYQGYTYSKKIIDNYENKNKNNYTTSQLITNSDYLSTKDN